MASTLLMPVEAVAAVVGASAVVAAVAVVVVVVVVRRRRSRISSKVSWGPRHSSQRLRWCRRRRVAEVLDAANLHLPPSPTNIQGQHGRMIKQQVIIDSPELARIELEQPSDEDVAVASQFVMPSVKSILTADGATIRTSSSTVVTTATPNAAMVLDDDELATLPGDTEAAIADCDCCCCRGTCDSGDKMSIRSAAGASTIGGEIDEISNAHGEIDAHVDAGTPHDRRPTRDYDAASTIGSRGSRSTFSYIMNFLTGDGDAAAGGKKGNADADVLQEYEEQQRIMRAAAKKLAAIEEGPDATTRDADDYLYDRRSVNSGATIGSSEADGESSTTMDHHRFNGDTLIIDQQPSPRLQTLPLKTGGGAARPKLPIHFVRHVRQSSQSSAMTASTATTASSGGGESLSRYLTTTRS